MGLRRDDNTLTISMKTPNGCTDFNDTFSRATRRNFIQVGSLAGLGVCLGEVYRAQAEQKFYQSKEGPAKSVIQIRLPGGIAAQESWDPKPEAPIEYRGAFGVSKTKLKGIVFSEVLKESAGVADKLCVVRSLTGKEADHGRATYAMFTGYRMSPAISHPSMGSCVNHEFGERAGLPGYIAIPNSTGSGNGTGYLSPRYGAFGTGGDPAGGKNFQVRDLRLPANIDAAGFQRRKDLRSIVETEFRKLESNPAPLDAMDSFYKQAYTMISSQAVRDAFDLSAESEKTRKAYGEGKFLSRGSYGKSLGSEAGMRLLLARRLVEAGARFITVNYQSWDDHVGIREQYQRKMPAFDYAFAALIRDLDERGLLDNTLVWVCSEFGRSPKINASAGRDHYARVFSTCLAGGGLKKGLIYGSTDATASEPANKAVSIQDLHHTIYHQIGINADKELMAPGDRPVEIVDGGSVVNDLIA